MEFAKAQVGGLFWEGFVWGFLGPKQEVEGFFVFSRFLMVQNGKASFFWSWGKEFSTKKLVGEKNN